jgi:uncharacterized coiled-coil DUF342 family protein
MNKIIFALLLGLFVAACQNTPKSASETPPTTADAPAPPAAASPEEVQSVSSTLTNGVKAFEDLRKQVDGLPAKVKKEKAAEIDGIYSSLEGMIEKQMMMMNEIKAANPTKDNTVTDVQQPINTDQLTTYKNAVERYAKEAQTIQAQIGQMTASDKKQ